MAQRSVCDSARSMAVPMPKRLFSQQNSTGSRHSAARFSDSWKAPSATAPSPKKQAVTRSSFCNFAASPSPVASGRPPPTMALPPNSRVAASNRCIEPPRPRAQPSRLPYISAMMLPSTCRAPARGRVRGRWRRRCRPAPARAARRRPPPPRRCRDAGSREYCRRRTARPTSPPCGGCAPCREQLQREILVPRHGAAGGAGAWWSMVMSVSAFQRREVALGQAQFARLE